MGMGRRITNSEEEEFGSGRVEERGRKREDLTQREERGEEKKDGGVRE
jgi:hypothetical protein